MPSNGRAIATYGWFTGFTATHGASIATWGWGIDDSPPPHPPSARSSDKQVKPSENPREIRRALQKINEIFGREYSVEDIAVAATSQTQGDVALNASLNIVAEVLNEDDSVTLPTPERNRRCIVVNESANQMQVYPPTDCTIDALATDAATTQAAGTAVMYIGASDTAWYTLG